MTIQKIKRTAKAGDSAATPFDYAFASPGDGSGDSPAHALVGASGALIDPATAAGQATIVAALAAPVLAAGAATDANLVAILNALKAQVDLASTLWTDNSGAFYVRRDIINEGTGAVAVTFTDPTGTAAVPGAGLKPAVSGGASALSRSMQQATYDVTVAGTGYAVGDILARVAVLDMSVTPPSVLSAGWLNLTQGTTLTSAPAAGSVKENTQDVSIVASALPTGAATDATLVARLPLDNNKILKTVVVDRDGNNVTYGGNTPVLAAGSVGTDYSSNPPAIPNVGANFGNTGPYANYVLLKTIPALATRAKVEVQNTSGAPILVLRDDGTAAAGAAPANATLYPLAGAPSGASGAQGGSYASTTFKGRCQIYGPSAAAFVAAAAE